MDIEPLAYAYNAQVHHSTGISPFVLTLSRHPLDNIVSSAATAPPADTYTPYSRNLRLNILQHLQLMFCHEDKRTELAQAAYKRYFDRKVRLSPTIQTGQGVYLNRPPVYVQTKNEKAAHLPKSKFASKSEGPYRVVRAIPRTVTICEDDIEYKVSVDRCPRANFSFFCNFSHPMPTTLQLRTLSDNIALSTSVTSFATPHTPRAAVLRASPLHRR